MTAETLTSRDESRENANTRFLGAFTNKIDAKGRISTPADFRRMLAATPGEEPADVICYPGFADPVIECGGSDLIDTLIGMISNYDYFDEQREALEISIHSEALRLSFDDNGRIILPASFREFAGLTSYATFVGLGNRFQIWQPEAHQQKIQRARSVMAEHRETLKARSLPSLAGKPARNLPGESHE